MNGKCAKCGRERNGNRYKVYFVTKSGERFKETYSNLRIEYFFICDACARMGRAGTYLPVLIIFGLMGLPLLGATVAAIAQDGFAAGLPTLIFGLVLLAPAVWAAYALITAKPTEKNGEYAALRPAFLRLRASGRTDTSFIPASDLEQFLRLHPDLALDAKLAQLTAGLRAKGIEPTLKRGATDDDLPLIREYMHFLAQQWWEAGGAQGAICERCNQEVAPGSGCLAGTYLYHARCYDELLQQGDAWLRQDADRFLGPGVLDKAREFAANRKPA